jgi:hypothetical protein
MTKAAKLAVSLFVAAVVFFFAIRSRSYTRTMMVISPEQWTVGQSRNCVASGVDPVSKLPQLNCDMVSHDMVRSQMFVQDVRFSRRNKKRPTTYWTCQKAGESLACRN